MRKCRDPKEIIKAALLGKKTYARRCPHLQPFVWWDDPPELMEKFFEHHPGMEDVLARTMACGYTFYIED